MVTYEHPGNAYEDELDAYLADAHSCRVHDNGYGYCTWCGAIIPGTPADYDEHGYDPPETIGIQSPPER